MIKRVTLCFLAALPLLAQKDIAGDQGLLAFSVDGR